MYFLNGAVGLSGSHWVLTWKKLFQKALLAFKVADSCSTETIRCLWRIFSSRLVTCVTRWQCFLRTASPCAGSKLFRRPSRTGRSISTKLSAHSDTLSAASDSWEERESWPEPAPHGQWGEHSWRRSDEDEGVVPEFYWSSETVVMSHSPWMCYTVPIR